MNTLLIPLIFAGSLLLAGCNEQDAGGMSAAPANGPGVELLDVAERGDVSALDTLLGRRVSPDVRDQCQWTPLMKAALNGHLDAVTHLVQAGARVDAEDKGGYTALMLAASNNHAGVVAALLDAGAMIDHQERTEGVTALVWAAKRGHRETVDLLLARGADRTLPDFSGNSANDYMAGRNTVAVPDASPADGS
jgi:ankyrin repeat protein